MIEILPLPSTARCDFCLLNKPLVEIYYPRPGPRKFVKLIDAKPGWAACADCKQLIDKREFLSLASEAARNELIVNYVPTSKKTIAEAINFLMKVFEDNF